MKVYYDQAPYKHHRRKWMPLTLHILIEIATLQICKLLDRNRGNRLITIFQHLILGFNTGFPRCCIAWFIVDELRGFSFASSVRERAGVDIALAIDDFWSGYLPCPTCATRWLNGEYLEEEVLEG